MVESGKVSILRGLMYSHILTAKELGGQSIPFKKSLSEFLDNLVAVNNPIVEESIDIELKYFVCNEQGDFINIVDELEVVESEKDYSKRILTEASMNLQDFFDEYNKFLNELVNVERPNSRVDLSKVIFNSLVGEKQTIEEFLDQSTSINALQVDFIHRCLLKD